MGRGLDEFFDMLFALVIALLAITGIAVLMHRFSQYDKFLVERNTNKASSHYTVAYNDFEAVYDASAVLSDILQSDIEDVRINGVYIPVATLTAAREHSGDDIKAIKNILSGNYKKSYIFSSDGSMTGLVYESR